MHRTHVIVVGLNVTVDLLDACEGLGSMTVGCPREGFWNRTIIATEERAMCCCV
jgi:hypothetical protein